MGTPYVARWFPRNRQGFAMGIYGAGNSGAAVNKFVAPALLVAFGADSSTAVAADLIWRLVWFLPQLLVGLVTMGIYLIGRRHSVAPDPIVQET